MLVEIIVSLILVIVGLAILVSPLLLLLFFVRRLRKHRANKCAQSGIAPRQSSRLRTLAKISAGLISAILLLWLWFFLPHSNISGKRDTVRLGMTVSDVIRSQSDWMWLNAVSQPPDADGGPRLYVCCPRNGRYLLEHEEVAEAELLDRMAQAMSNGHEWKFMFTYHGAAGTPQKLSFAVTFAPNGSVSKVSDINTWD